MPITSLPLIAAAVLATAATVAATVLFWSRGGPWRMLTRTAGVLTAEALLVLSAGLILNRAQEFYPSWQALAGDTGPAAATAVRAAGALDAAFASGPQRVTWQPSGSAGWRLRTAATITVPPGYAGTGDEFPALVALGGTPPPADLVEVTARPGPATGATALAGLPALLGADVRVTGRGWALVAVPASADLAADLARADPGRFTTLAVSGVPPAGFRCPPGVTVGVAARPGVAVPCHATRLPLSWAAATGWATGQTALPLAAPQVLPVSVRP